MSDQLNAAISSIIGGNHVVRDYLGRSLFEASEASQCLFDALTELVDTGLASLEDAGVVRRGTDRTWRTYAVLFIILGPILLSRQLEARLGTDAFDPAVVQARSSFNIDLLRRGLFTT